VRLGDVASDRYSLALLLARTGVAVAHRRLGLVAPDDHGEERRLLLPGSRRPLTATLNMVRAMPLSV
jgi:hypothetical protein